MKTRAKTEELLRFFAAAFMPILSFLALSACDGGGEQPALTLQDTVAPVTSALPGGGAYGEVQYVTLASNETATIYCSRDGADPAQGALNTVSGPSPLFWIRIGEGTTVLKFFAIDAKGNQEPVKTATYVVTIPPLPPPIADAGPDQSVLTGSLVTLDGSGSSTANGINPSYRWSLTSMPAGSAATLSDPTAVNPTFTADLDGSYVVSLVVNDGQKDSALNTVTITAHPYRLPDTGQTASYTLTFGEDSDYTINPPSYTDNGNGTITDNNTGLIWQKQDDGTGRTWDAANTYCAGLSLAGAGWRLPTRMELLTIADYGRYSPAINTAYFPNTQLVFYWASTASASNSAYAWYVSFNVSYSYADNKTYYFNSRCVR